MHLHRKYRSTKQYVNICLLLPLRSEFFFHRAVPAQGNARQTIAHAEEPPRGVLGIVDVKLQNVRTALRYRVVLSLPPKTKIPLWISCHSH